MNTKQLTMEYFSFLPRYLQKNFRSTLQPLKTTATIVGSAIGIFIMCWNVTTFILFSRHFTFLAATQYPFLKYCVNNSIIPIVFLLFYLIKAYVFAHYKELIPN